MSVPIDGSEYISESTARYDTTFDTNTVGFGGVIFTPSTLSPDPQNGTHVLRARSTNSILFQTNTQDSTNVSEQFTKQGDNGWDYSGLGIGSRVPYVDVRIFPGGSLGHSLRGNSTCYIGMARPRPMEDGMSHSWFSERIDLRSNGSQSSMHQVIKYDLKKSPVVRLYPMTLGCYDMFVAPDTFVTANENDRYVSPWDSRLGWYTDLQENNSHKLVPPAVCIQIFGQPNELYHIESVYPTQRTDHSVSYADARDNGQKRITREYWNLFVEYLDLYKSKFDRSNYTCDLPPCFHTYIGEGPGPGLLREIVDVKQYHDLFKD